MNRKSIKSSNINSVGYDIEKQILELEFSNGGIYRYIDVDMKTVVEFIFADSIGKYFHSNIKSNFKYVKGESNNG